MSRRMYSNDIRFFLGSSSAFPTFERTHHLQLPSVSQSQYCICNFQRENASEKEGLVVFFGLLIGRITRSSTCSEVQKYRVCTSNQCCTFVFLKRCIWRTTQRHQFPSLKSSKKDQPQNWRHKTLAYNCHLCWEKQTKRKLNSFVMTTNTPKNGNKEKTHRSRHKKCKFLLPPIRVLWESKHLWELMHNGLKVTGFFSGFHNSLSF